MKGWFVLLAGAAIACSDPGTSTTGGNRGGSTGKGGAGASSTGGISGSGGATGGQGGAGGASMTGTGGGSGGSGGRGGAGSGGAGVGGGGTAGSGGGSAGSVGSGGSAGSPEGGTGTAGKGGGGSSGAGAGGGGTGGTAPPDASTGTDAGGDGQQACTAFADAYCAKLQTCSTFVMSVAYGDLATCKQRWILNCVPNFGVTGTSATPARTSACAQSMGALACPTFLSGDLGTACAIGAGTVAQGGPCGDDAQCASTFCARAPTAVCGTCQPATMAGDPCVQSSCSVSTNTVCPAGKTSCVKPVAGKVGDSCVGHEQCDIGHQVGCNPTNSRCIALTLATAGGNCGANSIIPTSVGVCPASGTCSASLAGQCSAVGADGASCSTADTGTHCMPPARCVASKCTLPTPATCR
ncbi:MAG TPA: hypothetical protein VK550_31775 [Polyangiaceae bacterium]|nr:hypothetical protein [Polyangiaceae bacterium]